MSIFISHLSDLMPLCLHLMFHANKQAQIKSYATAIEKKKRLVIAATVFSFFFSLLSLFGVWSFICVEHFGGCKNGERGSFARFCQRREAHSHQVGTAVVTRKDGRLAVGKLGALCEQIKELNSLGYEVILVSSGAVGLGRQRLKYRKLVNSSFADLEKPQVELDGKACAAVGQSSLMAIYDSLFSQLDVTSAQLLVTDNDFRDRDFRKQLTETVKSLLALKVIPVFNENDAVSTRKAPYEGLYSGPPSDPESKLIHTYIKEKHQNEITFGDKSRVGRGGMTAKVKASVHAAEAGIPVIITSGYAAENIIKVLQGQRIGTLFHKDAHKWAPVKEVDAREMAVAARDCSRRLQALPSEERKQIMLNIADALEANEKEIRTENEADVAAAQEAGYEKSLITSLANNMRTIANMDDPIGRVLKRTELADGLILEKISSPIGVLLIVFESRPDALVQIASLAIRSGNGLLLKGGKEAKRSNAILHKVITEAIPDTVGGKLIGLLDDVIDLVIPRGSNQLVSQIKSSTKIPVLGHADGICHVYIDKSANLEMARRIVLDAKIDYPAGCNAMETLLVHKDLADKNWLNDIIVDLRTEGVTLYGGPKASSLLNIPQARSFHHEYSSLACTIEIVDDVAHTDSIVAEDHEVADAFLRQVDSAAVFHNASTRFSDGARFGLGAEVGISTSRIHARGPVGVDGLLTTRWILKGSGQIVDGDKAVSYTHRDLTAT
ncbi:hypothetical protein Ahy_A03g011406 isoform B [Arachis hypogaea]|uniref:Delta-1-pyrroline-5-carboxylate synthase n=1 Tax=Arachis hypogaea TaxID=3818 RepID=A0A445DQM5_ARAHY|nr:hypothetical protein Ahy_A03g011406 isoform B [Arachis hypogaea]